MHPLQLITGNNNMGWPLQGTMELLHRLATILTMVPTLLQLMEAACLPHLHFKSVTRHEPLLINF